MVWEVRHLTDSGKFYLMELRSLIRDLVKYKLPGTVHSITLPWLIGFIEADVTFSISNIWCVRMKFENTGPISRS